MKKLFRIILSSLTLFIMIITFFPCSISAESTIQFTDEEQALIQSTIDSPIKMGILPHSFPLSVCPPETSEFEGINMEMLSLITEKTGLHFEYGRIPTDSETPYQTLIDGDFSFVAGTIKLQSFEEDSKVILSNRFGDGSSICIALNNTNPLDKKTGKIAIVKGYQAGSDFSKIKFPDHEIVFFKNNQDVMKAVRNGEADAALISRYVGIYELQNPLNEDLAVLPTYQTVVDSCIMGLNTTENKVVMSILNKALDIIGSEEYNHIQVNFSITHPYELTLFEFVYKYRYIILFGLITLICFSYLVLKLVKSQRDRNVLSRDSVTGAYSLSAFELEVKKILQKSNQPLFITVFDILHFSNYNELHGKNKGDELLKKVVDVVCSYLSGQDVVCRSYADNFIVLSCKDRVADVITEIKEANAYFDKLFDSRMLFNFGIYQVTDTNISISKMIYFASIAKKMAKANPDNNISLFNDEMLKKHLEDTDMLSSFNRAIDNKEFVAYYQPKFDVYTQKIVGAEALVRWIAKDNTVIPPIRFIELFEQNGQIQRLDFYMLEEVCIFIKKLIDQHIEPVPVSINFSRVHLFSSDFVINIKNMVEKYHVPKQYIQIECTETVMTYDTEFSKKLLGQLQDLGFTIAMDDFGKAYSALNTLRSMPLDIVKLDGDFLQGTLDNEVERANKVILGIVSLVHDLSLKIVAEGVETENQYLFLKSIGCDYIQGYYFSRPLTEEVFYELLINRDNDN